MRKKAYFNWSSGKDSALALYHALHDGEYDVELLFSVIQPGGSIAMHETSTNLLRRQAEAIGLPLVCLELDPSQPPEAYAAAMARQTAAFRAHGLETALFGDLYLAPLRRAREEKCRAAGLEAAFPLWGRRPQAILSEFLALGFHAVVTCVDGAYLPGELAGSFLDWAFLERIPSGVDLCGENGEYHTFVFDGPIFRHPVVYQKFERFPRDFAGGSRYWYCRLT